MRNTTESREVERLIKTSLLHKMPTNLRGMIQFLFKYANDRMVERGVAYTDKGIKDSHFS